MSDGLSDHDSGQPSGGDKKQPPAVLFDHDADDEIFDTDEAVALPDTSNFSMIEVEVQKAEVEPVSAPRPEHPKRLIEARREAKRMEALLREVYDEE